MAMKERESIVAGQFYPADPGDLRRIIVSYAPKPEKPLEAKGVVVPHAGYVYSGAVAGKVFSSVRLPGRVILLGPNHTGRGTALALAPGGSWRTPLGAVSIDTELNRNLLAECPRLQEDPSAHLGEHSLEVQIPFLQVLQPDFRFAAICARRQTTPVSKRSGTAWPGPSNPKEPVLLVASSDTTHYERQRRQPARPVRHRPDVGVDLGDSTRWLPKEISACGFAPTVAVLLPAVTWEHRPAT
jgi:AmmeMemoRadiSam system protein B